VRSDGDDRLVQVFKALADPHRQRLLDRLHADNGQTLTALCRDLAITRQGITQHLAVLEGCGLVSTVRRGREKLHYLNPVPLHEVYERWVAKFEQPDLEALGSLKQRLERTRSMDRSMDPSMDKAKLVYVTYIAATPDEVWAALSDPELTAQYWGHRNVSGWAVGDRWEHQRLGDGGADGAGTILEVDPPRRLTHSWGLAADAGNPERQSRVTFDIEPAGDVVRLTVTHEDLPADEADGTREGWAKVLSSLKSFLETGRPLISLM
jgi:uncharacterized protein YndB with AHSA1/START domain/DNA-binding transcriptional ArsR family regulator